MVFPLGSTWLGLQLVLLINAERIHFGPPPLTLASVSVLNAEMRWDNITFKGEGEWIFPSYFIVLKLEEAFRS